VHFINDGVALPTTGARPYERGVGGHATLVHNVETLAQVALIARHGDAWFRELGRGSSAGSLLLTLTGAVARPGVIEVPHGVPLAEVIGVRGPDGREPQAVLLGGYVGGWVAGAGIEALSLDAAELRGGGRSLGCGVVSVLPHGHCGVAETARILTYLAGQSARQCGPCVFGLAAIAAATTRLSWCAPQADDLSRIRRWSEQLGGRGACKHPDGAAAMLLSALGVFEQEFRYHQEFRSCPASGMERYAS
jgi:NADH:ubiquinone oxidoreductase subunit F (NADH-binding)